MTIDPLWQHGVQVFDYVTERGLSGFDFQALNRRWMQLSQFVNEAARYGVGVVSVPSSQKWRALGAYHLSPSENGGRHHLYIDVLGTDGRRVNGAVVAWTVTDGGTIFAKRLDKPADEPGCDIPMNWGDTLSVWVSHGGQSDTVKGFHTRHPDEGSGNRSGHHSYFVSFMMQTGVIIPPDPVLPTTLEQRVSTLEKRVAALEQRNRSLDGDGK